MAISDCSETPEFTRAVAKVCLSWWGVTWPRPARAAALVSSSRSTSLETRRPWWVSRKSASRPVRGFRTGRPGERCSNDPVDQFDGFGVQRHHPFSVQLAQRHLQPGPCAGDLVHAVQFQIDQFTDPHAGRSGQQQGVGAEPVG